MSPSLENRQRIALLVFFVGDHLLWYWGGHFQQASLFYVIASEILRAGALTAVIASCFGINILEKALFVVVCYCYVMLPLNLYGFRSQHKWYNTPSIDLLWFKRDSAIPIDHGFAAFLLYVWFLLFLYYLVFKPAGHPLLKGTRQ